MRGLVLALLALGSLGLGGCVASLAATAVGAAIQAATPEPPVVTEDRRAAAAAACTGHAAQYGRVHVIDAEQRSDGRVTVWGRVEDDSSRRAFECRYDEGEVSRFTLREIAAPQTGG